MNQENEQQPIRLSPKGESATLFPPARQLLQQREKQRKEKRKMFLAWCFLLAVIWADHYFEAPGKFVNELVKLWVILLIVLWPGLYLLAVLHEFGHTAMGWLAGKKLVVFCFWRFRFENSLGGWRLRCTRSLPGISGFCIMRASALESPVSRLGEIGFLLGGGLANLVCAALLWGIYAQPIYSNAALNAAILGLAVMSVFLGVLNLLPLNLKTGWRTDGHQAWDLLRNRQDIDFKLVHELAEQQYFNIRPRDWSAGQVLMLNDIKPQEKPFFVQYAVNSLKFQYACDCKSWVEAEPYAYWIAQHFVQIPDGQRQGVAAAMALYALYGKHDQRLFEAWQIWCDDAALLNLRAYRTLFKAWRAYFAGEYEEAKQAMQETRLAMPCLPFHLSEEYVQEYLDDLQQDLQKACSLKSSQ